MNSGGGAMYPPPGTVIGPSGRLIYDGKRMRKPITRRTVDHNACISRFLEWNSLHPAKRLCTSTASLYSLFQPTPSHVINLGPPIAYPDAPLNAITSKFTHLSLNKQRCPVNAVRWMPDGRRLLTGTSTGEFTLWNAMAFNFETILQAHDTAIRAMSWSHNGNFLATGDHSGIIKIWQPSMNNLKILSNGHKEPVRQVTFAPNDGKFASCSDDGTVKLWDFASMVEERALTGHGWDVKCIHWHPFKALLASGSKDNLIKLWDPRSGSNIATIHGHKNTILDVKWNRNGNWLLTASKDQIVKLFDVRTLKEMQTFRSHAKEVNALAWHPVHEGLFATAGAEGAIYFHLYNEEEPVGALEGAHDGIIWSIDWHPVGHVLASGSADCSTRFWSRHRPGDTLQDKFTLGKQAAESLGIVDNSNINIYNNMETVEDEDLQVLPGLGSERRPPPPPRPTNISMPPPQSTTHAPNYPLNPMGGSAYPPMPPPGWRPPPGMPPIPANMLPPHPSYRGMTPPNLMRHPYPPNIYPAPPPDHRHPSTQRDSRSSSDRYNHYETDRERDNQRSREHGDDRERSREATSHRSRTDPRHRRDDRQYRR